MSLEVAAVSIIGAADDGPDTAGGDPSLRGGGGVGSVGGGCGSGGGGGLDSPSLTSNFGLVLNGWESL